MKSELHFLNTLLHSSVTTVTHMFECFLSCMKDSTFEVKVNSMLVLSHNHQLCDAVRVTSLTIFTSVS